MWIAEELQHSIAQPLQEIINETFNELILSCYSTSVFEIVDELELLRLCSVRSNCRPTTRFHARQRGAEKGTASLRISSQWTAQKLLCLK